MINRSILITLAALAAGAAPATSQGITSPYDFVDTTMEVWAFGTAAFTDRGAIDVGPASGYGAGIGFTARVSGPFNFDARVAYIPTTRTVFDVLDVPVADSALVRQDPTVGLEEVGTADLAILLLDASLRFDLTGPRTWNGLQPYALVGAGAVIRASSDDSVEEELPTATDIFVRFQNGFTGHVGAGVEWHLADRLSVRFDARDILWKVHVPTGFFRDDRVIDTEEWVQTAHLSLGLAYRF